jgi:hypothetical protein
VELPFPGLHRHDPAHFHRPTKRRLNYFFFVIQTCLKVSYSVPKLRDTYFIEEKNREWFLGTFVGEFFCIFSFYVRYSTLLYMPPLRFHCIGGGWDRTLQDCCSFGNDSQTL